MSDEKDIQFDNPNAGVILNRINADTLHLMLNDWTLNTLANIQLIKHQPSVKVLEDAFKDKPCVITSAGEDLDKQLDYLKLIKEKVIIVTPETCLHKLISNGIRPDVVVVTDGTPKVKQHIYKVDTSRLHLVCCTWVNPDIIHAWRGRIFFYLTLDDHVGLYNLTGYAVTREFGGFLAGGCVAHTCMFMALAFGCSPILIGQNLSWKENLYAKDIPTLPDSRGKVFKTIDINGDDVFTNESFWSYRHTFDYIIPRLLVDKTIYNATEGGILGVNQELLDVRKKSMFGESEELRNKYSELLPFIPVTNPVKNLKLIKFKEVCESLIKEDIDKTIIDKLWEKDYIDINEVKK